MISDPIQFHQEDVMEVDASTFHGGGHIGGTRFYTPVSETDANLSQVFDERKPARSHYAKFQDVEEGCIVDLKYRNPSNSVNTPYRVESVITQKVEDDSTTDQKFIIVFEPIIQNAALVLVKGTVSKYYDGSTDDWYNAVYYKHPWNNPCVTEVDVDWTISDFFEIGFQEKNRTLEHISIVFDEILAPLSGFETELFAVSV